MSAIVTGTSTVTRSDAVAKPTRRTPFRDEANANTEPTTIVPRAAIGRQGARGLHFASFADPLYDTNAFIARADAPLSPAARAFVEIAEHRLERVSEAALYVAGTSETEQELPSA